jgi:hypothetical protein
VLAADLAGEACSEALQSDERALVCQLRWAASGFLATVSKEKFFSGPSLCPSAAKALGKGVEASESGNTLVTKRLRRFEIVSHSSAAAQKWLP